MFKNIEFNEFEKDVFILKAVIDIIDSIVNHLIITLNTTKTGLVEVVFNDYIEQSYFNIMLVDLISLPAQMFKINDNYIDYLYNNLENANFNDNNSIGDLRIAITNFKKWLDSEIIIEKMWFPTIEKELNFKVERINIIKICGNKCKHNFTRLTSIANILKKTFKENNLELTDDESFLAVDDFYNWFHGDGSIFTYYSSILAEMLNNIRWGIQNYMYPEYCRSYTVDKVDIRKYSYKYPDTIRNQLAKIYYWDLMNDIRSGCIFDKFSIPEYMKKYY